MYEVISHDLGVREVFPGTRQSSEATVDLERLDHTEA
jgi:hypothetical protein